MKFASHAEGYIEPDGAGDYNYAYQYTDIWNNVRVSYSDFNENGTIDNSEIVQERNYYPFGLIHQGYNGVVTGTSHSFQTFQDQEFSEDLDLNVHEWKYRFSDPSIGRFWQIDPLAEKYTYNSTYAFQENKLGSGVELEGLENSNFDSRQRYRDKQYLKGKMTKEEYIEGGMAEAKGAAVGISLVIPGPEDVFIGAIVASKILNPVIKSIGKFFTRSNSATKIGEVILEKGAKFSNEGEKSVAELLASEGKTVKVLAESTEEGVKSADFLVDGIKTELKTISNLTSKDLSNAMKKRILSGVGQAKNVIIDVSKQSGATQEVVDQAIKRAFGASENLKPVRVIGDGFDFTRVAKQ